MLDVRLDKYIHEMRTQDFEWGKLDCVLFACNWAEEHVGVNPAEGSQYAYNDEKSAYEHLKERYGGIEDGLDKHFKQIAPTFRQKGDIALCRVQEQEILGICGGRGFVFFKAKPKGIFCKREPDVLNVWRVSP